ncbi:hypothetical protein Z043_123145, partial [Scleropages formosus]
VTGKHSVLSVAQNWVPILDKVFDQKWCSDLWQIKETPPKIPNPDCFVHEDPDSHSIIEQETTSGEKDVGQSPWLQLDQTVEESVSANSQGTLVISTTGSSTMPVHPSTATEHSHHSPGDDVQLKSQSMLHRLLTLPSQGLSELLCSNSDISLQTFPTLADTSVTQEFLGDGELPTKNHSSPLGKKEEGVLENVELRGSVEKKSYSCKHCGRKFNQQPMMKVHQQTHGSSVVCCSLCGKRFSQPERLQTHLQAHTAKQTTEQNSKLQKIGEKNVSQLEVPQP